MQQCYFASLAGFAMMTERKKKQQYYEENIATCPSCGANFMPDENNNCSYCGYGLQVYNGKWKVVNG